MEWLANRYAAELYEQIWKPLEPHLVGARTVLVGPDASLARMPLAALPGRRADSFLIEDIAIGYVTSGRDIVNMFGPPARDSGQGLLAIGGIRYEAEPGLAKPTQVVREGRPLLDESDRGHISFLPGTEMEARRCRELFQQAFPKERATLLVGAEPSEARVKQEFNARYRYIHLATHGFFESPRLIATLRADRPPAAPTASDLRGKEEQALALLPLLRSGVVLAGAARPPKPDMSGSEDGILTAEEVAAADLRGTELVALSACDTGLGEQEAGQGVLGLQRAFHAAGARTLVASLWKVDDAATSLLMEALYINLWQNHLPKLEALRQAQLTVLRNPMRVIQRGKEIQVLIAKEAKKPLPKGGPIDPAKLPPRSPQIFWAAFVLSGDIR